MAGELAIPTFVSGAKDDLAATDVYKRTSSAPINSVQVISNRSNLLSASGLRGGSLMKGGLPSITSLISTAKNVISGKGDPLSRLTGAASVVSGALRTLAPGVTTGILGQIGGAAKIVANLNGASRQILPGNLGNVSSIGALINTMSSGAGNFSIKDNGALIGTLSGVIVQAAKSGLPSSFGPVLTGITDKNIINRVAGQILPAILKSSDIGSLSSMANLCSPGALKMINPSIISGFASNYLASPGQNYLATMGNYTKVMDTFTKIDPPWATTPRSTTTGLDNIINVTSLQSCTPDFQAMLATGIRSNPFATTSDQALLLNSVFKPTTVNDQIKSQFPSLVLTGGNQRPAQDPRTLGALQISTRRTRAEVQQDIDTNNDNWTAALERETGYLLKEGARLVAAGDADGAYRLRAEVQRIRATIDAKYDQIGDRLADEYAAAIP